MKLLDVNTNYEGLGQGNRTGKIFVSTNFNYNTGNDSSLERLVNGTIDTNTSMPRFISGGNEENYIQFDFEEPVFFDELTLSTSSSVSLGKWRLEGRSHRKEDFRTLSIIENLRGNTSRRDTTDVKRKDPIKYISYRFVHLEEEINSSVYFREFEFKIGEATYGFEEKELNEEEEIQSASELIQEYTKIIENLHINEDGKMELEIDEKTGYYKSKGHWESEPIPIKGMHSGIDRVVFHFSDSGNIKILARVSDDGIIFGEYKDFSEIKESKSTFIQVKIELHADKVDRQKEVLTEEEIKRLKAENPYLDGENNLFLANQVVYKVENVVENEEGFLFEKTIPSKKFKRIDKIGVSSFIQAD